MLQICLFISFIVISNEITNEAIAEATFVHSNERLVFHERCGSLVKLTNNRRTAERRRPLDEFNNGVVMTNRPIKDDEMFEVCHIPVNKFYQALLQLPEEILPVCT